MADPLTILGALAAAIQLVQNGLKLALFLRELSSQVRGSRDSTNQRIEQLQHMNSIARLIISNPMLQTDEMESILQSCLNETRKLETVLHGLRMSSPDKRRARLKRSWKAMWKEKEVNDHFRNLEQMKSMIGLCISEKISTLQPIISKTSSAVATCADNFPAILESLAAIEQKIEIMDLNRDANFAADSRTQLEPIVQNLLMNQKASRLFPNFGSKVSTHYHIPPSPRGTFAGFSDTLLALKQRFSTDDLSTKKLITLTGVACGGKSQVALEFCYRAQSDGLFGAIFWVKSATTISIEKGLNGIAETFNIPKEEATQSKLATLKTILAAWPYPYLLVFDNYNSGDSVRDLEKYIPSGPQGSVLFTQKTPGLQAISKDTVVHLPALRLQDAAELLLKRSAVAQTDKNYEQGVKLALALNKIPRAILQAGSYIKKHRITVHAYLKMFEEGDARTVAWLINKLQTEDRSC